MGQPITVVEKPSSNPAVIRFETNRPLTGMGHERYSEPPSALLDKTVDELARRLFAAGGVEAVHVNGSVVTVSLERGRSGAGLGDVVRQLFLHYGDQPAPVEPAAAGTPVEPAAAGTPVAPEAPAEPPAAPATEG
ncbi:MAG: NifU N-terminal domain-containing protein [Acidimicrobiales bacterium]|nr:NifU N-terminal domain-containing protein [Acidimicrobiales bacterium]